MLDDQEIIGITFLQQQQNGMKLFERKYERS